MPKLKFTGLLVILIVGLLASPQLKAESIGIASGNLATADACGFGKGYLGGTLGLGDDITSFVGTLNYGFSEYTEGKVRFGFADADGVDASVLIGADLKYEVLDYYEEGHPAPFDLALGGFFEWVDYGPASVLQLGGNVIGSIPYRFKSGQRLVPYGRFNVRMERVSAGDSESDIEIGLNLGTKFELNTELSFYGEIQLDGNTGLFFGTELRVF